MRVIALLATFALVGCGSESTPVAPGAREAAVAAASRAAVSDTDAALRDAAAPGQGTN